MKPQQKHNTLQTYQLGSTDLKVSRLCFGGNVFGWTVKERQAYELLDYFYDNGFNFIDTADIYSYQNRTFGGDSESIIGKWVKKRNNRSKVVIATKVGMDLVSNKTNHTRKYIFESVEGSLKRLNTDYIDLYQTHIDDGLTPVEEPLYAYQLLIKQGKIRYIGASNFSSSRLEEAIHSSRTNNLPKYISLQPRYNLCEREFYEKSLEHVCIDNGLSVINYFPLAAGFLTGKYRTEEDFQKSIRGADITHYLNPKNLNLLTVMDKIADKHQCSLAGIAIAWLLARPSVSSPIASATNLIQLSTLIDALTITLDQASINLLNEASKWK